MTKGTYDVVMTKNNNSKAFLSIGNPSQVFKAFTIYKNTLLTYPLANKGDSFFN